MPNVFRQLERAGGVSRAEMFRVFNMGVGMLAVVAPDRERQALETLGNDAWRVGEIVEGDGVELCGA